MATPDLIRKLLGETPAAKTEQQRLDEARKQREREIDAAAEQEGMMMLRGSRRIRQRKW